MPTTIPASLYLLNASMDTISDPPIIKYINCYLLDARLKALALQIRMAF